jgi:hypothetical protein
LARTKDGRQRFNWVMQKSTRSRLIDSIGGYESVKYGKLRGLVSSSESVEEVCSSIIAAGNRDAAGKGDSAGNHDSGNAVGSLK